MNAFFSEIVAAAMRILTRSVARFALNSWVAPGFVVNDVYAQHFITGLSNWNWAVGKAGYSGVMPSVFSEEELRQILIPLLLLIGDRNRLNPPSVIERAMQLIPQLEAEIIPHSGHLLSMEQPERVDQRVLKFLAEV